MASNKRDSLRGVIGEPALQLPNPRQVGQIIGRSIENFPLSSMLRTHPDDLHTEAQVSRTSLHTRYLLLAAAAALHTIETSGLSPEVEQQVAQGVYDWFGTLPREVATLLTECAAEATDTFSSSASDDFLNENSPADFSQMELEFFEQLMTLGADTVERQKSCLRLSAVLPKHLWQAQVGAVTESLRRGGLLVSH